MLRDIQLAIIKNLELEEVKIGMEAETSPIFPGIEIRP